MLSFDGFAMPSNAELKHALYHQVGKIGRALGQETRLEIIEILAQAPRTVEAIAQALHADVKSVSAHLKVLHDCALVDVSRQGRCRRYAVSCPEVLELAVLLRKTAQKTQRRALEMLGHDFPQPASETEAIHLDDALELAQRRQLLLIDVRPAEEYEAGHIEHAVNIPLKNLEAYLESQPPQMPAAAYCRSPYCFLAREAQRIFAAHGRCLLIVEDGMLDWKATNSQKIVS